MMKLHGHPDDKRYFNNRYSQARLVTEGAFRTLKSKSTNQKNFKVNKKSQALKVRKALLLHLHICAILRYSLKFPWWDTILELGLKFFIPYGNWLRGSDIGGMTGDVTTVYDCWTTASIIFKNASSLAACLLLSSFKKSNISLRRRI